MLEDVLDERKQALPRLVDVASKPDPTFAFAGVGPLDRGTEEPVTVAEPVLERTGSDSGFIGHVDKPHAVIPELRR